MGDLFGSRIDPLFGWRIDLSHYRAMISACEEKG